MTASRTRISIPRLRAILRSPLLRRCALIGTVLGLGCWHFALAAASIQHKSATFDEVAHITAGYSYWTQNDYRLHPENGNLPQRWMTLPLVVFNRHLTFPDVHSDSWHRAELWQLGDEFFHHSGNDVRRMLLATRCAIALVSVALCLIVFFWSRRLFGTTGGLISLAACAFSPTVLAHGRLATSDMFAAFFFSAAVWSIWELLHRVTVGRLLAGCAAVSGLFLCKTTAVLILPMAAVMALITLIPRQAIQVRLPRGRRAAVYLGRSMGPWPVQIPAQGARLSLNCTASGRSCDLTSQWSRRGCVLAVAMLITVATYASVWAAYGFRYAASSEGDHAFYKFQDIATASQHGGFTGEAIAWLADKRMLPEAYLYGAAFVAAHEERPAFLNGEYETRGWRHFFPYCLAVKTPLALFGLLAIGTMALPGSLSPSRNGTDRTCSSHSAVAYQLIPLAVALTVLWAVFLGTQLNIGHRHILPTYPFMFVLAGSAGRWCRRASRLAAGAVALLLMWLVTESMASFPHYLSYFNQFVPRDKAYQHLVDSSLDWGQDLPGLKQWLDRHQRRDEPVYLGYFGTASPAYYGIHAQLLPLLGTLDEPLELRPGTYCISATCLQSVYGFAPGRWNEQYETRYQQLGELLAEHHESVAIELRLEWDTLRARRLAACLRHRDPDDHVGYSILIYRLTADELDAALHGPPAELDRVSWAVRRALQLERANR